MRDIHEGEKSWFNNKSRRAKKRDMKGLDDVLRGEDPSKYMGWVIDCCKKWGIDLSGLLAKYGLTYGQIRNKGKYEFPESGFWDEEKQIVRHLDLSCKPKTYFSTDDE